MSQVAPPEVLVPVLEAELELTRKLYAEARDAVRYYANDDVHEDEMDGYAFIPGTAPIYNDNGRRARHALKEIRKLERGVVFRGLDYAQLCAWLEQNDPSLNSVDDLDALTDDELRARCARVLEGETE